jgi:hypothetical protein
MGGAPRSMRRAMTPSCPTSPFSIFEIERRFHSVPSEKYDSPDSVVGGESERSRREPRLSASHIPTSSALTPPPLGGDQVPPPSPPPSPPSPPSSAPSSPVAVAPVDTDVSASWWRAKNRRATNRTIVRMRNPTPTRIAVTCRWAMPAPMRRAAPAAHRRTKLMGTFRRRGRMPGPPNTPYGSPNGRYGKPPPGGIVPEPLAKSVHRSAGT